MTISVPVRLVPVTESIEVWVIKSPKDKETHDFWWGQQRNKRAHLHARNPRPVLEVVREALVSSKEDDPEFDYSDRYKAFKQEGSVFDEYYDPGY